MAPKHREIDSEVTAQVQDRAVMRRKPRQERARETVRAILEAAALLLVEIGYDKASTNLIAKRAGVSIGSLYQYFPDKDAVFLGLLEQHRKEMEPVRTMAMKETQEGLPLAEVAEGAMRRSIAVRDRDPDYYGALDLELAGLIARHLHVVKQKEHADGVELMSSLFQARTDTASDLMVERSWLVNTVLEAVCQRLVHEPMDGLDRDAVVNLTSEMMEKLLQGSPRTHE